MFFHMPCAPPPTVYFPHRTHAPLSLCVCGCLYCRLEQLKLGLITEQEALRREQDLIRRAKERGATSDYLDTAELSIESAMSLLTQGSPPTSPAMQQMAEREEDGNGDGEGERDEAKEGIIRKMESEPAVAVAVVSPKSGGGVVDGSGQLMPMMVPVSASSLSMPTGRCVRLLWVLPAQPQRCVVCCLPVCLSVCLSSVWCAGVFSGVQAATRAWQ